MFYIGGILSLTISVAFSSKQTINVSSRVPLQPFCLAADDKNKASDPGRDITPDPHGPDPHGPDASEEVHDKDLPANNPDKYLGDKKKEG